MRICILSSYPPMACGIGKQARDLSRAFAKAGHDVHVLTYKASEGLQPHEEAVSIHRVLGSPSDSFRLRPLIRAIKPDVFQFESAVARHSNLVNLNVAMTDDVPIVTSVHDAPTTPRQTSKYLSLQAVYSSSDLLVFHSWNVLESQRRFGVRPRKAVMIPLGVGQEVAVESGRREGQGFEVLFYGIVRAEKGLEFLIEAYRLASQEIPGARLQVVGPVEESANSRRYYHSLLSTVRREGLSEVRFYPRWADEAVSRSFIDRASVVVFPHVSSGNSLAVADAMAAGKCVVCSDVGGFREVVHDGVNGILVPPRDPGALASALERVYGYPQLASELGNNARRFALERNSIDGVAQRYLKTFGALLA